MPKTIRGTLKQVMTQAASLKPYTMEETDEMLLASEKDFENGDYVTNEEVLEYLSKVEESESWESNAEKSFRTLHERTPYK